MPKSTTPNRAAAPERSSAAAGALPSREELIAFIGGEAAPNGEKPPARVTKRDIARAFGVKGEAKAELKLLIRDLQADGAIGRGRKALQVQGRLPAIVAPTSSSETAMERRSPSPPSGTRKARRREFTFAGRGPSADAARRRPWARAC